MSGPMISISRQCVSELQFLRFSRYLYVLLAVVAAGVVIAFTGSLSNAQSAHENFVDQVKVFQQNGITLDEALNKPVVVTRAGDQETIDNPLKYDYLEVGKAVRAVEGTAMIGTALDLVTFIVAPLLFLILGANLANYDRTSRTAPFRAARERWIWVTVGKMVTIVVLGIFATLTIAVCGLVVGAVGSSAVHQLTSSINYELSYPTVISPLALKMVTTALVCTFFGLLGYAVGIVTRSSSWPMVLAAAMLFLLPFVSRWDPRNLLAVVGSQVYDFWGQFQMRPPITVSTGTAVGALVLYSAAAVIVILIGARRVRLT